VASPEILSSGDGWYSGKNGNKRGKDNESRHAAYGRHFGLFIFDAGFIQVASKNTFSKAGAMPCPYHAYLPHFSRS